MLLRIVLCHDGCSFVSFFLRQLFELWFVRNHRFHRNHVAIISFSTFWWSSSSSRSCFNFAVIFVTIVVERLFYFLDNRFFEWNWFTATPIIIIWVFTSFWFWLLFWFPQFFLAFFFTGYLWLFFRFGVLSFLFLTTFKLFDWWLFGIFIK